MNGPPDGLEDERHENGDLTTCCGRPLVFDPTMRGTTCGGLDRVGWLVCSICHGAYLSRRGRSAADLEWRIAKGGRSITAGSFKLRCEAANGIDASKIEALMRRLVRLPALELEVEVLRAQLAAKGWQ